MFLELADVNSKEMKDSPFLHPHTRWLCSYGAWWWTRRSRFKGQLSDLPQWLRPVSVETDCPRCVLSWII